MSVIQQTSREYFKFLRIILFVQCIAPVMMALVMWYVIKMGESSILLPADLKNVFLLIALVLALGAYAVGQFLYRNKLIKIRLLTNLKMKMQAYRTILIVQFALLEAASIFTVVAFFIFQEFYFLLFTVLIIVFQLGLSPGIQKVSRDLELSVDEKSKLENPDEVIYEMVSKS